VSDSTEIVVAPFQASSQLAHPLTGEVIDLVKASDEDLAGFLDGLDSDRNVIQEAKRIVAAEAIRRMDRNVEWTLRAGPYQLSTRSPEATTRYGPKQKREWYDGMGLRSDLLALVDEGVLTIEAVDAACEVEVICRVKTGGVNKLLKLGGEVAQVVQRHAYPEEPSRYVSVKKAGRV
jgi:hypothetical protein